MERWNAYRRVLPGVFLAGVLAEGAAAVQLDVELVVVPPCTVDVHAVGVIRVSGGVKKATERAVESYPDLHVVVLALRFDV